MFLPVEAPVDWEALQERKQKAVAKSIQRENSKRTAHNHKTGDWITILKPGILRKLSVARAGPFKVIKQRSNGPAEALWVGRCRLQLMRLV